MIKNTSLIDADIVCYRAAAAAEQEDVGIALHYVDKQMDRILERTQADDYKAYLSGDNNFRFLFYPEYKANRKGKPEPRWRQQCKTHMILHWNAEVTDGYEADDAIAMKHYKEDSTGVNLTVCSIDKDLLQIPGDHFNWVKDLHINIDYDQAMYHAINRILLGDRSDNIPGYDGKSRDKPTKQLQYYMNDIKDSQDPFILLYSIFEEHSSVSNLIRTGNLVHLLTNEEDFWYPQPINRLIGQNLSTREQVVEYVSTLRTAEDRNQCMEPSSNLKMISGIPVRGVSQEDTSMTLKEAVLI